MQRSLLGALFVAALVIAATAGRGFSEPASMPVYGRSAYAAPSQSGNELITHVSAVDGHPQTVTVIDPSRRVMGIYHVDRVSGEIALRSIRNFTWDLQMVEFNSGTPLPQDIRSGLPR